MCHWRFGHVRILLMDECDFSGPVAVVTFPMPAGTIFDWHVHEDHQLAWAERGVLTVRTASAAWVLPPTRALWIPAGVQHETLSEGAATMRSAYLKPTGCDVRWDACTPVLATTLLTQLICYLEDAELSESVREHAVLMLVDLLQPTDATSVDVLMPVEERARQVAEALARDPTDNRTLEEWGGEVGASSRTLSRSFVSETGVTFGRFRSLVRVRLAMEQLAAGTPVANVASLVGYESPSAFASAFKRETGITPASFARRV